MLSLTGSFRRRLCRRRPVGIAYEVKNDAVVRETMALNAALLPMLMRARRSEVIAHTRMDHLFRVSIIVYTDMQDYVGEGRAMFRIRLCLKRHCVPNE